ncbi:HlyD family secretion protein [Crassaminicella profunda]|uniref:HlyD family secretion protein n=1 Tax=Crassaminicella profunda TaxID=1286698 RepID=UPI001CA718D7|nr:efflux RND transporter periplasmic adaptor subunit [Crassaminicella profunda]QZY54695.1 efflux RND transporter periplasmic adaptor subunit [Crassaminicella profunda]
MYKKLKIIGVCFLFSVLLVACSFTNEEDKYTGTVECEDIDIASETSGLITEIFVKEGAFVKKGDKLCRIDVENLKLELNQAEASLKIANAKFDKLQSGARNEEINQARVQVEKIKSILAGKNADYAYRLKNYEDLKKLYESGAVSKEKLEEAKVLLDNASAILESTKKELESAKLTLDLIIKGTRDEEIQMAFGEVEKAKAMVEQIKYKISKENVIAPIEGTIESINYNKGELIPNFGNFATVLDLKNLWVKIYIPEKEFYKISLNQEINMTADFIKNKKTKGKVINISQEAEFTPKNVESKENKQEMVFAVKIKILDDMEKLKPGMLMDVYLGGEKE